MTAYDVADWSDLFVGAAGASAALAGLVFVAISINVDDIVKQDGLAERGLATVMLLVGVVLVSLLGLIPGQTTTALGIELLVEALGLGALIAWLSSRMPSGGEYVGRGQVVLRHALFASGTVPFAVGAVSLLVEAGGGLYWVAAGILFATVGGVANAWVLLIEIRR